MHQWIFFKYSAFRASQGNKRKNLLAEEAWDFFNERNDDLIPHLRNVLWLIIKTVDKSIVDS